MNCVAIMAKLPELGAVKTRLARTLGDEATLAIYRAMLADRVSLLGGLPGIVTVVAFAPPEREAQMRDEVGPIPWLLPQRGRDLGERLANVASELFARGAQTVSLVDSDTPLLPRTALEETVAALASYDVVLGPARDGGYYLIAIKAPQPALFAGVTWSTSTVLAETLERAAHRSLRVHQLPMLYDVDEESDLDDLVHDLAEREGEEHLPAHTVAVLRRLWSARATSPTQSRTVPR